MKYVGFMIFGAAFIFSGFFFWYTYRHIREPDGGRQEESHVIEARKIKAELALERRSSIE